MATITLDGTDLATLGFKVEDDSGLEDGVSPIYPTMAMGGIGGQVIAGLRASYAPRKCSLTLLVNAASLSAAQTSLDGLKGRLAFTGCVLLSSLRPGRQLTVRLDGQPSISGAGNAPKYLAPFWFRIKLPLVADDPFWKDTSDTVTAFTTATNLVTGAGPSMVDVVITGPATNPVITLADSGSVDRLSASPVITIAGGDIMTISRTAQRVTRRISGVTTECSAVMPIGFDFFEVRESWFNYGTSAWAKIRTSTGTGSATVRNRWP